MTTEKVGVSDESPENNKEIGNTNAESNLDVDNSFFKVLQSKKEGQLHLDELRKNDAKVLNQRKNGKYH